MIDFTGLKKYWTIAKIVVFFGLIIAVWVLAKSNSNLSKKAQIGENNTSVLLSKSKEYKTKDSLNAAEVYELNLKLKDFDRFKAEDAKTIASLNVKNRKLESVISINSQTSLSITAKIKDSISTYKDSLKVKGKIVIVRDTLKCFAVDSTYYSISGCFSHDNFTGHIFIPEWLKIAISVKHKRFLGFLWYINKIKDKKIDVVSKNPYIKILDIDFTTISK
jgi:hypothetical protein